MRPLNPYDPSSLEEWEHLRMLVEATAPDWHPDNPARQAEAMAQLEAFRAEPDREAIAEIVAKYLPVLSA